MVAPGKPGRTTKFAGPWSSLAPSPRSSSLPMQSAASQAAETESANFPAFESNDNICLHRTSTPSPTRNSTTSGSSPLKHSWGTHKSTAQSSHRSKKGMAIPEFYAAPSRGEKNRVKPKVHIIPHRRKTSARETTSLDLSVSAVENEGLGIYTNYDRDRRNADTFATVASRTAASTAHNRSSSGNSVPTASRHGTQYVHPMRQIPRPYTPPLSRSDQTSIVGSEPSDGQISTELDGSSSRNGREPFKYRSSSLGSHTNTDPRPSFNLTDDSFTRIPTSSQTNSRTVDGASLQETVSPVSRNSLDFAFRSKSRTSTSNDPMARAAAVQAARQAFEDREAEKARRLEKAQGKELKRRERKERHQKQQQLEDEVQRPSMQQERASTGRAHLTEFSFRDHGANHNEKASRSEDSGGRRSRDLYRGTTHNSGEQGNEGPKFKNPKSAWLLFLTWLRTRIFKMGKKLKKKKKVG